MSAFQTLVEHHLRNRGESAAYAPACVQACELAALGEWTITPINMPDGSQSTALALEHRFKLEMFIEDEYEDETQG